jgi:hypothetical protein
MIVKTEVIKKATFDRYKLVIDDQQALDIKNRILNNSEVYDIQHRIKMLPQGFWITLVQAGGMIAIMNGLLAILLVFVGATDKFFGYFLVSIQGLAFGQLSVYLFFYIYYLSKEKRIIKKQMYINIASLHHSLRHWTV